MLYESIIAYNLITIHIVALEKTTKNLDFGNVFHDRS